MKSRKIIGVLLLLAVSLVILFYGTQGGAGLTLVIAGAVIAGIWVAVWVMPHGHHCTCDRCSAVEKCNCKPECKCDKGMCTC